LRARRCSGRWPRHPVAGSRSRLRKASLSKDLPAVLNRRKQPQGTRPQSSCGQSKAAASGARSMASFSSVSVDPFDGFEDPR
jgi:hypothetical protein